ncbi:hypothetical protein RchiOBHm_Chr1g0368111 [Rosa chinensis]|uniref:Uncharacterized protein n=1 Tax=Rosa chinensis TaxID=74649 RepID=A0A2P6SKN0_ROSCH|nr:hypothetical protein RchiOBHm_Chr1g0368111 [Rosa chinensis]
MDLVIVTHTPPLFFSQILIPHPLHFPDPTSYQCPPLTLPLFLMHERPQQQMGTNRGYPESAGDFESCPCKL